jgi:hypothetical protein
MPDSSDLSNYLDKEGRVNKWPSRQYRKSQRAVLEFLANKFEQGKQYTERQVNDLLNLHHTFADTALLRRELIVANLLNRTRNGSAYWRPEA